MIVWIILGFVTLLLIGFVSLFRDFMLLVEKRDLLAEFRQRFVKFAVEYFDKDKMDNKEYQWLLENVDEVSSILGGADTMTYRPAFANYVINNYQLLINLIPSFISSMGAHRDDASSADSILARFIGTFNKYIENSRKKLINPINWLTEGVATILSMPLFLLGQFGILGKNVYGRVRQSRLFGLLAGIIGLISTADAIYAIASGNSFTVEFIKKVLGLI